MNVMHSYVCQPKTKCETPINNLVRLHLWKKPFLVTKHDLLGQSACPEIKFSPDGPDSPFRPRFPV